MQAFSAVLLRFTKIFRKIVEKNNLFDESKDEGASELSKLI